MTEVQLELLQRAANEISQLRNHNQLMAARLDVFDKMVSIFHAHPPNNGGGMSPDIVWEINKVVENSKTEKQ